ncbi:MAG: fumarate hydratase [Oscillospiraceae bacterium]|nr:fumarate hydratase [Oscillospiraceae bacterium]
MREITAAQIADAVCTLTIQANRILPDDIKAALEAGLRQETADLAAAALSMGAMESPAAMPGGSKTAGKPMQEALPPLLADIRRNWQAAEETGLPVCQDTGMSVVFAEVGQEVHITGGLLMDAVNAGVARATNEGYLRASVVDSPLSRRNTGDNTPAVLHTVLMAGDSIKLTVAPKGFGSENMSRIYMLTPAAGKQDIIDCVVDAARRAGGCPCPPMVLGVGLGGDFELCALLAKKALCRGLTPHPQTEYAALERDALAAVNELRIGVQGFGAGPTALFVAVETYPTHIAGLPVAVNVGCHVNRHAETVI